MTGPLLKCGVWLGWQVSPKKVRKFVEEGERFLRNLQAAKNG